MAATDSTIDTQEPPANEQSVDTQDTTQVIAATEELATQMVDMQNLHVLEDIVVTKLVDGLTVVTQEPPARDINDEASTKEPSSHPHELATETAITTKGPVTLASLQQENDFIKAKIQDYKQELIIAREAYEKELNLYTLA